MPDTNVVTEFWKRNHDFIHASYIVKHDGHHIGKTINELLSEIFCAGPSYYYIIDFATREIEYISPSVKDILGINPDTATFDDIVGHVHPEDFAFINIAEEFNLRKIHEIGMQMAVKTKLSYCFRERTVQGNFELFQLQSLSIDVDAARNSYRILNIHTNINHLTTVNSYITTLMGVNGHNLFLQFDLKKQLELSRDNSVFTRRELEIVKLVARGMETQEIADQLFISPHTTKTHRKNIMQKAGAKNTAQLISFCLDKGLL